MHQNRLKLIVFLLIFFVISCEKNADKTAVIKFNTVGTDSILVHSKASYSNESLKVDYVFENKSELDTFYFLLSNWDYTKKEIENHISVSHKIPPSRIYIVNYLIVYPSKYESGSHMAQMPTSPYYKKMPLLLQIEPGSIKQITVEINLKIKEIFDNWRVYTQLCFTNKQNIAKLMNILSYIELAKITRKDEYIYINFNELKEDDYSINGIQYHPPWRIWKTSDYKIKNIEEATAIINCFYLNTIRTWTNIHIR